MNKFQDRWSRFHDKPCINGEPKSNNGFVYSSYSKYLAPGLLDQQKLEACYKECKRLDDPLKIDRSPNEPTPVLSKDEVIGLVSLGLLSRDELEYNHWNFCNLEYTPKKLNFISVYKAARSLYKLRDFHRNYFWENEMTETYALAFYLPPHDQYYVNKFCGYNATIFQTIMFYINFITVFYKGNKSVRMLLWLQCEDMRHFLLRFIPKDKWVVDYFTYKDHPFVKSK